MCIDEKSDRPGSRADDDDDDVASSTIIHEVRQLRLQLELCIANNDQLRQRLEDCARNHHSARCVACRRPLSAHQPGYLLSPSI